MGCSKSSSKREGYSNKRCIKKQERFKINNLTVYLKKIEKEQLSPKLEGRE